MATWKKATLLLPPTAVYINLDQVCAMHTHMNHTVVYLANLPTPLQVQETPDAIMMGPTLRTGS